MIYENFCVQPNPLLVSISLLWFIINLGAFVLNSQFPVSVVCIVL